MDWMNIAKEGYSMYQKAHESQNARPGTPPQQESSEYQSNQPPHRTQQQGGGGYPSSPSRRPQEDDYSQGNSGRSGPGEAAKYYEEASGRQSQSGDGDYGRQSGGQSHGGQQRPSSNSGYDQSAGNSGYGGQSANQGYGAPSGGGQQSSRLTPSGNSDYNKVHSQFDPQQTAQAAHQHAGGDEDPSLFSSALQHANSPGVTPSLDHSEVESAHTQAYESGDTSGMDARSMGSAAAMQAFKKFTGGGGGGSGAGGQGELLSMAMGEAVKLFNSSGGGAAGNKQDAINSAVQTVMKLVLQSKMGAGGAAGGGQSGGLSSLMGMASKFL